MRTLEFKFEVVTPMFIGGASPNGEAELRPPSIKGMLRWWFRALGGSRDEEERIFGKGGKESWRSKVKIYMPDSLSGSWRFDRNRYSRYDRPGNCNDRRIKINGIVYAGYSLGLGGNNRKAIPAGRSFRLVLRTASLSKDYLKAIEAVLWAMGNLGGLGTRWRRGFGSVQLVEGEYFRRISSANPQEWRSKFSLVWREVKNALLAIKVPKPAALWQLDKVYVWRRSYNTWEDALNEIASQMQEFRQCRNPDHDDVYYFLAKNKRLNIAPERSAFGLPITFRFRKIRGSATFMPADHERMASPVIFHIAKLNGNRFLPLLVKMKGPFLEKDEKIRIKERRNIFLPKPGNYIDNGADDTLIKSFINEVVRPITWEVPL